MKIKLKRDLIWHQFDSALHLEKGHILDVSQSRLGFYFGYLGEHVFISKEQAEIIPDEPQPAPVSALAAHLEVHRDTLLNNAAVAHHEGRTDDRDRLLSEAWEVIDHLGGAVRVETGFVRGPDVWMRTAEGFVSLGPPAPPVPDVGEGYRQVMPGEVIQDGDEFRGMFDKWHRRELEVGNILRGHTLTRRKVEPRYQYVLLAEGDVVQKGDEFYHPDQRVWMTLVLHSLDGYGLGVVGKNQPIRRKVILDAVPSAAQTPGV